MNASNSANPFGDQSAQDAYFESLLKMKETDPENYKKLSPSQRMSLGYYLEGKGNREQKESEFYKNMLILKESNPQEFAKFSQKEQLGLIDWLAKQGENK